MAANSLQVDPENSTWQTLVGDQRYRLFAAGNRKAAIAECLPVQSAALAAPDSQGTSSEGALHVDAPKRLVLLTEVSPSFEVTPFRPAGTNRSRRERPWRWEAAHSVQPISQLQSYIDEQSGSLVFFLTRAIGGKRGIAAPKRERLEESAVRIGRSLGLDDDNLEALRLASLVHEIGKVAPPIAALGKFSSMGDAERYDCEPCKFPGCQLPGAATLRSEHFCREHFIMSCYERLDSCREKLGQRRPPEQALEEMRAFLRECTEQAADLTRNPFSQDALERARLLDILHTAGDLSRRVRRSPRCVESFDVRVLCETPGRPWEEDLRTLQVSRHGAMFECAHLVRPEDWLFVERVDTGIRARARMAWREPAKGGHFMVGLEFVDSENFWGLKWADA